MTIIEILLCKFAQNNQYYNNETFIIEAPSDTFIIKNSNANFASKNQQCKQQYRPIERYHRSNTKAPTAFQALGEFTTKS